MKVSEIIKEIMGETEEGLIERFSRSEEAYQKMVSDYIKNVKIRRKDYESYRRKE